MKTAYIPALDGLRAIAVLSVLLVHSAGIQIGWVGVQIFFVLSGYLISSNLLRDRSLTDSFSEYLKIFYWRRLLRIFPIYYAYVLIFALIGIAVGAPRIHELIIALVTYTVNIYAMLPGHASLANIGHFWSLAVEEQFYLVWPLLVFFCTFKHFRFVVVGIIAVVPLLRFFAYRYLAVTADAVYAGEMLNFITFFQMDAFAIGAAISVFPRESIKKPERLFWIAVFFLFLSGVANLALLKGNVSTGHSLGSLFSTFGYPHLMVYNLQYVWGYSLINIACGLLIWCIVYSKNPLPVLSAKPLLYLGRRSYGIYVYHVPVLVLLKELFPYRLFSLEGVLVVVMCFVCTIMVSHLSYQYFEKRFLGFKKNLFFGMTPKLSGVSSV